MHSEIEQMNGSAYAKKIDKFLHWSYSSQDVELVSPHLSNLLPHSYCSGHKILDTLEGPNRIYFESFIDELWKHVNFNPDSSAALDHMLLVAHLTSQHMAATECIFIYIQ